MNRDPFQPLGEVAAKIVAGLRFRRKVVRLYDRGPRPIAELLAELGAEQSLSVEIERKIDQYLNVSDAALDAAGGRDLPPVPLHEAP